MNLFVQVSRFSDGTRRITHITEVIGMEQDIITLQDIFLFEKTGITEIGQSAGPLPRHRHPAQVLRPAEGVRHRAAHADVPDGGGD